MAYSDDSEPSGPFARLPKAVRYGLVVAVAVIGGLGIAFVAATLSKDDQASKPFGSEGAKEGEPISALGPLAGADLDNYVKSRQKPLSEVKGQRIAVVSLSRYTSEGESRTAVGNTEVLAMLAASPGGEPSIAQGDLKQWAAEQKTKAKEEREGLEKMLRDTDDPGFQKDFKDEIARLNALAEKVNPAGPVVFGVVVRADAQRLRDLARSPGVRLVDVGSSATPGKSPVYRGLRPEETAKAGNPRTRPL